MTTVPDAGTYDPVDRGTYEVLRDRLTAQAAELARRAEALNARRIEEFGSTVPVHPGFAVRVDRLGNLVVTRED